MVSGRSAACGKMTACRCRAIRAGPVRRRCFSIRSASRLSSWPRSRRGIRRHGPFSKAVRAAWTALSTSAASASATWADISPVAGLMVGKVRPLAESIHRPSTSIFVWRALAGGVAGRRWEGAGAWAARLSEIRLRPSAASRCGVMFIVFIIMSFLHKWPYNKNGQMLINCSTQANPGSQSCKFKFGVETGQSALAHGILGVCDGIRALGRGVESGFDRQTAAYRQRVNPLKKALQIESQAVTIPRINTSTQPNI